MVALDAGLAGVVQEPGGALRPVAGWALVDAPPDIENVIDRLIAEHDTTPPPADEHGTWGGGEVIALYHRIGSASLFGGAWRLLPGSDMGYVTSGRYTVYTRFELADGRHIGEVSSGTHWAILRDGQDPATVPVLGTSLAHLLDAAMDTGGDVAHLETMKLADL